MKSGCSALFIAALAPWLACPANAQTVTFDFDTGMPALATGQNIPFDQTSGGVTAHFSSPSGSVFSVQTDVSTGWTMSQFSGKYLYDNNLNRNALDIQFSQPLTKITLTFATADFQQVETPTTIQLTAYLDSTATPAVGSATAHGTYGHDTMPMGTLTFDSGGRPFNLVEIVIPFQPLGASDFFVDNIAVTTATVPYALNAVASAASYASASIAPGEMVVLFGTGMGPPALTYAQFDATGQLPTILSGVRILFNGIPAPLVYVSEGSGVALVPFGLAAPGEAQVTVEYNGNLSNTIKASVTNTMPGVFSADYSGRGQGAIQNADLSYNTAANPAAAGSIIALYAAGLGNLIPAPADGSRVMDWTLRTLQYPVTVTIGGQRADIVYAGPAPTEVAGLYQINCVIPPATPPGPAAVVVASDGKQSLANLTVAVR